MELFIQKFFGGHELPPDDQSFRRDITNNIALPVDAPEAENQDGYIIQLGCQCRFCQHEPEKINTDACKQKLHKDRKPFGIFIGLFHHTTAEMLRYFFSGHDSSLPSHVPPDAPIIP